MRFLTKKRLSLLFFPSSSAFRPWPTTSEYSTSGGRWLIHELHMSSTLPPAGIRSRYSCVSCARNSSSTCVHSLGCEYQLRSSTVLILPRSPRSSTSRRIVPPASAAHRVDTDDDDARRRVERRRVEGATTRDEAGDSDADDAMCARDAE